MAGSDWQEGDTCVQTRDAFGAVVGMMYLGEDETHSFAFGHKPLTHHLDCSVDSDGAVHIPDAALLFSGTYVRDGFDLTISLSGETARIHDYFRYETHPQLLAPGGAKLEGAVVAALTHSQHGPEYAGDIPPGATPAIGRVETVTGSATATRNGASVDLHPGDLVYKGDAVATDNHGSLALTFLDGTAFTLSASARMVLNDMVYEPGGSSNSSLLSLVQGSINFVAGDVAHTGDMQVDTPVATMGIRGTAVHVEIDANNGKTKFSVMREPNGRIGRYVIFEHGHPGHILAIVDDVSLIVGLEMVNGQVVVETSAKTNIDLSQERDATDQVFQVFRAGQQNPLLHQQETHPPDNHPTHSAPNSEPPKHGDLTGPNGPEFAQDTSPIVTTAPSVVVSLVPIEFPVTVVPVAPLTPASPILVNETIGIGKNQSIFTLSTTIGVLQDDKTVGDHVTFIEASGGSAVAVTDRTTISGLYGSLTISPDGTFQYTADHAAGITAGHTGLDSFTYSVAGTTGTGATATLSFNVDGGSAVSYASTSVTSTSPVVDTPSLTSPAGGDQFAFIGASGSDVTSITGAFGSATINATTGAITYTSTAAVGTSGTDTFTVSDTDGHGVSTTATAVFDVSIPDPGSTVTYTAASVTSASPIVDTPSLTSPAGGDQFAFIGASGSHVTNLSAAFGSATINATTGAITYTSSAGAGTSGTDTFTVTDTDGHGVTTTATATFNVDGGSAVSYASTSVTSASPIVDTPSLTSPAGGDQFAFVGASGSHVTSLSGAFGSATINATTGAITYTSTAAVGTAGTDTFTVSDTDGHGVTTTATATFNVSIPDPGSTVTYTAASVTSASPIVDTPSLTSPAGGDQFAFIGASGSHVTNLSGAFGSATINATTGAITYTSSAGAGTSGTDTFTVTDTDGHGVTTTATATFNVDGGSAVSYASTSVASTSPVVDTPSLTSPAGGDQFAFVGASGSHVTSLSGAFGAATINTTTGAITYTSTAAVGTAGTDTFTVSDTDGHGVTTTATAVFNVSIPDPGSTVTYTAASVTSASPIVDTPSLTSPAGGDQFAFIGASGSHVTSLSGSFGSATINATTGAITYTSSAGAGTSGTDTFTVTDTDGHGVATTATAEFDVNISNIDSGTVFSYADTVTTTGNNVSDTAAISQTIGGDTFSLVGASGGILNTAFGTATINASDGTITYSAFSSPTQGTTNIDTLTVSDTDGNGVTTTTTVNFITDGGPTLSYGSAIATSSGTVTDQPNLAPSGISEQFFFEDGQGNAVTTLSGHFGTATIDATTGVISYTPNASGSGGMDQFTVNVTDSANLSAQATASFYNAPSFAIDNSGASTATLQSSGNGISIFQNYDGAFDPVYQLNGGVFALEGFDVQYFGSVTVNVAGYLNGTQVASFSTNESSANFSQIHLALDPSFSDVDQVVVTLVGSVNNGATNFVIGSTGEISNLVIPTNQSTALNILANIEASIPSGDSIVVAATSALGATLTTSGSDIIYDPSTSTTLQAAAFGQSLSDSFTYTVEDSGGHAIGSPITVTLDVNDPSADAIATVPLAPGDTVISLPDHSADGAALVSHGTSISYDPTASAMLSHLNYGQSVVDHFSYVDTAGPQTVAFTVEGYDHGPVVSDLAMSIGSDAAAGTSLTIAGHATGLDDLGTLQLDNGSAKTFSVSGGVFAVSADVGLGDHVATLTLQDQSTAAGSVAGTTIRQIDINIGGNDAVAMTSSTGGPAVLVGSAHANVAQTITGSHYADMLVAGAGNDALTGGGGGDTFVFKPVMGNDAITDFHATTAAGPQDVIDLTAFHFSNYQALLAATTDTTQGVTIALGGHTLTLDHVHEADLHTSLFHL